MASLGVGLESSARFMAERVGQGGIGHCTEAYLSTLCVPATAGAPNLAGPGFPEEP